MNKYLVDTCIYRDFFEDRKGYNQENLGTKASEFFQKVIFKKNKILYSEALIKELSIKYTKQEIDILLMPLIKLNILQKINISKEEFSEAKQVSKQLNVPLIDALNAIQARNHNAILITQDKHFFLELKHICKVSKPFI
jgi:predicted nucleic acid-binding protein